MNGNEPLHKMHLTLPFIHDMPIQKKENIYHTQKMFSLFCSKYNCTFCNIIKAAVVPEHI